jgi:hypothetical protein
MKRHRARALLNLKISVFSFAQEVAPLYRQLDWSWAGQKSLGTPSVDEIAEKAHSLIDNLLKDEELSRVETAGLAVSVEKESKGFWRARLEFSHGYDSYSEEHTKEII